MVPAWPLSNSIPNPENVYINRVRSNDAAPIRNVFQQIDAKINAVLSKKPELMQNPQALKREVEFTGELFLGHLRYGTFGKNDIENVHPVSRENNWMTRSLVLARKFQPDQYRRVVRPTDRSGTVSTRKNRYGNDSGAVSAIFSIAKMTINIAISKIKAIRNTT